MSRDKDAKLRACGYFLAMASWLQKEDWAKIRDALYESTLIQKGLPIFGRPFCMTFTKL